MAATENNTMAAKCLRSAESMLFAASCHHTTENNTMAAIHHTTENNTMADILASMQELFISTIQAFSTTVWTGGYGNTTLSSIGDEKFRCAFLEQDWVEEYYTGEFFCPTIDPASYRNVISPKVKFTVATSLDGGIDIEVGSATIHVPKYFSVQHPVCQMVLLADEYGDEFYYLKKLAPQRIVHMFEKSHSSASQNVYEACWVAAKPELQPHTGHGGTGSEFGLAEICGGSNEPCVPVLIEIYSASEAERADDDGFILESGACDTNGDHETDSTITMHGLPFVDNSGDEKHYEVSQSSYAPLITSSSETNDVHMVHDLGVSELEYYCDLVAEAGNASATWIVEGQDLNLAIKGHNVHGGTGSEFVLAEFCGGSNEPSLPVLIIDKYSAFEGQRADDDGFILDSGACERSNTNGDEKHMKNSQSSDAPLITSSYETTDVHMAHELGESELEYHSGLVAEYVIIKTEEANASATWIVATAAPHHATGNRDLLSCFTLQSSAELLVHAADGTPMQVLGSGNVVTDAVVLPDVWYIPGLTANLVSVSQLAELDYGVGFSRAECYIRNPDDGGLVGSARVGDEGLFEVEFLKVPLRM